MPRASEIFAFDERAGESPVVDKIWRTRSEPFDAFTSVAVTHWEIVVTKEKGKTSLVVRGPETKASIATIPQDAEFFGIQFTLGTFMPGVQLAELVDSALVLPEATKKSIWLNGSAWDVPTYDNADVFVRRLVREGLIVSDPVVSRVLSGEPQDVSVRSVQRHVLRATGLTLGAIRQIERANKALELLESGATILDTVEQAGYADQPHLNRSLKRLVGHTPAQIVRERA